MRRLLALFTVASFLFLGCQAEDPNSAPSAALGAEAAPERTAEPAPPAPAVVVEEVVVEEELPVEAPDSSADPRVSGPAGELSDALNARDEGRIMDAIALLEEEGGGGAIVAITTVITRSDDPEMKIEAIDSLAFLADDGDVSAGLEQALRDPSPDVRIEAADVIVELELTELLPVLRTRGYQESDPDVREVIEDAIFELEPIDEDERN